VIFRVIGQANYVLALFARQNGVELVLFWPP
jgi:hypothetical protein